MASTPVDAEKLSAVAATDVAGVEPMEIELEESDTAQLRGQNRRFLSRGFGRKTILLAVLGTIVVGAIIATVLVVQKNHSSTIYVPHTFAADYSMTHRTPDGEAPYTGSMYKTLNDDGSWRISARLEMSAADRSDNDMKTVITYSDGRGYVQLVNGTTGEVMGVDCVMPEDDSIPDFQEVADALQAAVVVPSSEVNTTATHECTGHDMHMFAFYGQTYIYCLNGGDVHTLIGSSFAARLFNVDTSVTFEPFAVPQNITGVPMECPELGVEEDVSDLLEEHTTSRRLHEEHINSLSSDEVLAMYDLWFLKHDIAMQVAHEPVVHDSFESAERRRLDHGDEGCCNCRRMSAHPENWANYVASEDEEAVMAMSPLEGESEAVNTVHGRSMLWSFFKKPDKLEPKKMTADDAMYGSWFKNSPLAGIKKLPGKHGEPFCICCMIPGIETNGQWKMPSFCHQTQHIELDVTKPWDDDAQQRSLCKQLTGSEDGGRTIAARHLYGLSTGNLVLAAAIDKGYCKLDTTDSAALWTVVEGAMGKIEDDPYAFCDRFNAKPVFGHSRSLGYIHVMRGISYYAKKFTASVGHAQAVQLVVQRLNNVCVKDSNGDYVPTTAAAALDGSYAGKAKMADVVNTKATSLIAGSPFGGGVTSKKFLGKIAFPQENLVTRKAKNSLKATKGYAEPQSHLMTPAWMRTHPVLPTNIGFENFGTNQLSGKFGRIGYSIMPGLAGFKLPYSPWAKRMLRAQGEAKDAVVDALREHARRLGGSSNHVYTKNQYGQVISTFGALHTMDSFWVAKSW